MIIVDGVARNFTREKLTTLTAGEFDLLESSYDNIGNSIHAEAPFSFWDRGDGEVVDARELRNKSNLTFDECIDFANKNASHYILSAANFLLFQNFSDERRASYERLRLSLERLEIPLVILGIGAQAQDYWNPTDHKIPPEAIEFMKFLGVKCSLIGVRGKFTSSIFRDYAGVKNTSVIGCPSLFQNFNAFTDLRHFLKSSSKGAVTFNATWFHKEPEQKLIRRAINENHYWVGVDSGFIKNFHKDININKELADVPDELKYLLENGPEQIKREDLINFFSKKYRRYNGANDWINFNRENVRFSYGTRFHGNMATLLAGRPALWVAHDKRTKELAESMHLPSVTYSQAVNSSVADLEATTNYDQLFDNLGDLIRGFNSFLSANSLPEVRVKY